MFVYMDHETLLKEISVVIRKSIVEEFEPKFDGLSARLDGLSTKVNSLSTKVNGLSTELKGLRKEIKAGFDFIHIRMDNFSSRMGGFENRMDDMDKHVSKNGDNIEYLMQGQETILDCLNNHMVSKEHLKIFARSNELKYVITPTKNSLKKTVS